MAQQAKGVVIPPPLTLPRLREGGYGGGGIEEKRYRNLSILLYLLTQLKAEWVRVEGGGVGGCRG